LIGRAAVLTPAIRSYTVSEDLAAPDRQMSATGVYAAK